MITSKGLDDKLNELKKHLDIETADPNFLEFILLTWRDTKSCEPRKKEMVNVKQISGENDDSDEVSDPQYNLFFESLKKYEKSYLLVSKINDVTLCVKYEEKGKSGRKREPKRAMKMWKDIERVDGDADQSPRLPNKQEPVKLRASERLKDRRNEISKKQPDLRNKGIIKESKVRFSKAPPKRMDRLGNCKVLKNMAFGQEGNVLTDNQSEPTGQAQRRKRGENVAKTHYVPDCESVMRIICDGCRYQKPDPRKKSESKNQSEPVGQTQLIKRAEGLRGKNKVVLSKHNLDTEKHLHQKPVPKHNSGTKYQIDHANQVVQIEEVKEAWSKTNLPKVMEEKNVVTDECEANRKAVNYRESVRLYPKPTPYKYMEERQHDDVDQTQPGEKVQRQSKLRKVMRGRYEIKVDDAGSRIDAAEIENRPLFHKPCPRKNQVTKRCIDQARPKQSKRMLIKERDTGGRDIDVEILDAESFYSGVNSGPFVTSKKFHRSVIENDDIKLPENTSLQSDFRTQVMNVLRKPYDKQESKRLREAFLAGSYVKFHPEIVTTVVDYRHKKGKCLSLFRGFFFWLENLSQQGSFKPWEDKECLQVDPTLLDVTGSV